MSAFHSGNRRYIWRPYFTTKDGRKVWAKWYGKRAFRIPVDPEEDSRQPRLPGL